MSYDTPPPPPPPGDYGQPGPYGGPAKTNQKALWSMILGIVGLVCCGPVGIAALILGNTAKKEIATTGEGGGGMATAGVVLGWVSIGLMVLQLVLLVTGVVDLDTYTGGGNA